MDLNNLIIVIAILALLIYFRTGNIIHLVIGFICVFVISYVKRDKKIENFLMSIKYKNTDDKVEPTSDNPLMNVMPEDYSKEPDRPPADMSYKPDIENKIVSSVKSNLDKKIFRDMGDNMELDFSLRQFYSTPNTTIPNDQKSFGNYLYGNMPSGKDNNNNI